MEKEKQDKLKQRVVYIIALIAVYSLASWHFIEDPGDVYLIFTILFWIGILHSIGFMNPIYRSVSSGYRELAKNKSELNTKLLLLTGWFMTVFIINSIGGIFENIPISILLFCSFLPIIKLFHLQYEVLVRLALMFIIFTSATAAYYNTTADTYTQLAYLLLATSLIQKFKTAN